PEAHSREGDRGQCIRKLVEHRFIFDGHAALLPPRRCRGITVCLGETALQSRRRSTERPLLLQALRLTGESSHGIRNPTLLVLFFLTRIVPSTTMHHVC